ncbi:MAG: peptide ABC transporter substrate-binding protein [Saccharofermentanales bacterium]|jgi:oligopeptide transport system substrate-binding protein
MKRRTALALVFVLVLTILLSACDSSPKTEEPKTSGVEQKTSSVEQKTSSVEQKLKVNMPNGSPTDINPLTATTTDAAEIIGMMLETLVREDAEGNLKEGSGLAESWDISEDGLTYTFKLKDAKWSDGSSVTADQFEYAWKKVLDPETASQYAYIMYPIKNGQKYNTKEISDASEVGVEAIDEKTLKVTLEERTDYFLSLLVMFQYGALPVGSAEEYGDDFFVKPEAMVFNGPFIMTEWIPDQKIIMVKNENYWDADAVKLETFEFDFSMETNTVVNNFDTGNIDVMLVQPEFLEKYKDNVGFVSVTEPVTEYLMFNMNNKYFSNENIRRAFSLAIDRVSYMEDFFRTGSTPAYGYIPPSIKGVGGKDFRESVGDLYYDRGTNENAEAEAKELLEKGIAEVGGTKEELSQSLSLVIGEGDLNLKTAQVLQEFWKDVLDMELVVKSSSYALRQEQYKGDYTIGKEGWGADYNDPLTFLDLFETGSPYNNAGYSSEKYDKLIQESRTLTGDARLAKLEEAEKVLLEEDFVIAPTFFQTRSWVAQDKVKGIVRRGIGLRADYKWAYIGD